MIRQSADPDTTATEVGAILTGLIDVGIPAAALAGSWFGHHAIIIPHLLARPLAHSSAFPGPAVSTRPAVHVGWVPYSGSAMGGRADHDLILCDDDGWHFDGADPVVSDVVTRSLTTVRDGRNPLPADPAIAWDRGDEAAHRAGVESCLEAIRAGEVYQACLSTRFHGTFHGDAVEVAARWFAARVKRFRPARAAFLVGRDADGRDVAVASLSPEEFLVRDGRVVRETPIKGTVPLDRDPADLLASAKDVAENIMIVDLVRHDLGQVAETGTVTVPDLLSVSRAPGVWHLHSTVQATLPEGLPHRDLVEACFPPASVTGTPKKRAAELIDVWEPESRGVHCGAIGASWGDRLELNVGIRTAEFRGADGDGAHGSVEAGVGGGITIDSTPEGEWAEVLAKAAPLVNPV
ncbi:aminodeoxychorismate synthase component I [Corynebacterium sp.]|uniref:aminodeoxychorismate synthase component I n=1 Tax=Corynebacterium sp. TaxID=1720 RepID=UPI0026DB4817|nr:aminodeoxychorismate synthase component I [Corynebacterium sp.]MDO4611131.1 aminodeoxychorismate synthase component I [Corynebacterium sp.]